MIALDQEIGRATQEGPCKEERGDYIIKLIVDPQDQSNWKSVCFLAFLLI